MEPSTSNEDEVDREELEAYLARKDTVTTGELSVIRSGSYAYVGVKFETPEGMSFFRIVARPYVGPADMAAEDAKMDWTTMQQKRH